MPEIYPLSYSKLLANAGRPSVDIRRPVVCVQGLGFVGTAMAIAVASARDGTGQPQFNVIGVDLSSPVGRAKINAINQGHLPVVSTDPKLRAAFEEAVLRGNLIATDDSKAYSLADVVVVDIHLDLQLRDGGPFVDFTPFRAAIAELGSHMRSGALIIVETTVPPGTCQLVATPVLADTLRARGLAPDAILLAHSYERVMPGEQYFDSIVNFWRVYAADTELAAAACGRFLSQVVNVRDFPLVRLGSTIASETAKVLENSYRATTIAFMEEWGRFAEAVGIDLFEVIRAIRHRPTHSNMRQPGFGVGGYCLTKDPLFAVFSATHLFGLEGYGFPFSERAVDVNRDMPLETLRQVTKLLGGILRGKRLLMLGVSYRNDVGDTRYSPSETLYRAAMAAGAIVLCHDPLVRHWDEVGLDLPETLPAAAGIDAVIFAVPHKQYLEQDWPAWLGVVRPMMFDANHVLSDNALAAMQSRGCRVGAIGRGGYK